MFYVEPLLLLALVAWVARGAPRPARWTASRRGRSGRAPARDSDRAGVRCLAAVGHLRR